MFFPKAFNWFKKKNKNNFDETNLPKNMSFHCCSSVYSELRNNNMSEPRPLAVIFGWLFAEDKHLLKYRQLWHKRGFDVLIVRVSLVDILLPQMGSQVVAKNLVKFVSNISREELVIHAFSIGGYVFGEVLNHMFRKSKKDHSFLIKSVKGVVMDSVVGTEDGAPGFSKLVANNPKLQSFVEQSIDCYQRMLYNYTLRHYNNSQQLVINSPVKCPGLIFYSKDDVISNYKYIEDLVQKSIQLGNDLKTKCWDESGHVLHYKNHQEDYEKELDEFLARLELKNKKTFI